MFVMLKPVTRRIEGITRVSATVRNILTGKAFTTDFLLDPEVKNSVAPALELKKIGIEPVGKRTYNVGEDKFNEYEHGFAEISFLKEIIVTHILFGPDDAQPVIGALTLSVAGIVVDSPSKTPDTLSL
jgi:hypothetical protein